MKIKWDNSSWWSKEMHSLVGVAIISLLRKTKEKKGKIYHSGIKTWSKANLQWREKSMSMSTPKTSENANTISTTINRVLMLSTIRKRMIITRIITTISIFRLLKTLTMSTDKRKTRIQDSSDSEEEDKSLLRFLETIKNKKKRKGDMSSSNWRNLQVLLLIKTARTKRKNKLNSKELLLILIFRRTLIIIVY